MEQIVTQKNLDELTYEIIGAAIEVYKIIGKGLPESIYHKCMIEELQHRKINFASELRVPLVYKSKESDTDFRCDLYIEEVIVVELKAAVELNTVVEAQLLTYMNLLKAPKGILINFCCDNIFKQGQKTFINGYLKKIPKF